MATRVSRQFLSALVLFLVPMTALATDPSRESRPSDETGIRFRGWGPRIAVSDSPDQTIVGAQFDLGNFARRVRFQPSIELGFGGGITSETGNLMVSYYFPVRGNVTPYAGGELTAARFNFENTCINFLTRHACGGSDTQIGPAAVGGIETRLANGSRFLAELQLGFGDVQDVRLLGGWTF